MVFRIIFAWLILVLPKNALSSENSNFLNRYGATILNEIATESDPLHQIVEYRKFFDTIKQSEAFSSTTIMLAYLVSELKKIYPDNIDLEYITNKLPPEILTIPWDMTVSICNGETNEYLCVSDEPHSDESLHYNVFSSFNRSKNCFWNFNVEENGRYFTIQNNANKRFIVANEFDAEPHRRTISTVDDTTSIISRSDKWQFEPYQNRKTEIFEYQIKNIKWQEYIIAQGSSNVFIGNSSHCDTNLCSWKLLAGPRPLSIDRQRILSDLYAVYKGDSKTAENLLEHASKSSTPVTEYIKIFKLMQQHNGFYSVAGTILDYNIKQLLVENPNDYDLLEMDAYFQTLWKPIPWNRLVSIKNKDKHRVLCSFANILNSLKARLRASNETCYWILEIDSQGFYFRIKHFLKDRYLAVEGKSVFDWSKRRITIVKKKNWIHDRWQLFRGRMGDHEVRIKNVHWNEVLYTDKKSRPSTMLDSNCRGISCEWLINASDNPIETV